MRKWTSEWFDLPADVTSEVPRIEMIGSRCLQIENHYGIEQFNQKAVKVKVKNAMILIEGEQLKIKAIYPEIVLVEGTIHGLRVIE